MTKIICVDFVCSDLWNKIITMTKKSKVLISYFSRAGENYFAGEKLYLDVGNTKIVAENISRLTGGELFEIKPLVPYPSNYDGVVKKAVAELKACARPELLNNVAYNSDFEVLFLGYPNWCGTMPMVVYSFLDSVNLSGKKILPFCTHEGSGFGNSERDLANYCSDSVCSKGISIIGSEVRSSSVSGKISMWLDSSKIDQINQ